MTVSKYRAVDDMPRPGIVSAHALVDRIRALWNRSFLLSPPDFPRGVTRFRSIEQAQAARVQVTLRRMRSRAHGLAPGRDQTDPGDEFAAAPASKFGVGDK